MTWRFSLLVGVLASLGLVPVPASAQTTRCTFGGPAPGFKAMRFDLATGSSFLNTEITGTRTPGGVSLGEEWHLAQGIVVFRLAPDGSPDILAYRLRSEGSSPPGAVVRAEGSDVFTEKRVPAPDVPFTHAWALAVSSLPAGVSYAVAWGAGGGALGPADTWGGSVELEGGHSCADVGSGDLFHADQNSFTGGMQVTVPGFALMDGATYSVPSTRTTVVGMIDAAVQGAGLGEARVSYTTPAGEAGAVERAVAPFGGPSGAYAFEAGFAGFFPVLSITGVAIDLP